MAKFRRKPEEILAFQAEEDGNTRVAQLFRMANRAMKERGEATAVNMFPLYEALPHGEGSLQEERLENLENAEYYFCSVCGFLSDRKPQEKCERCQADPSASFKTA
jgi:rubrerythrin